MDLDNLVAYKLSLMSAVILPNNLRILLVATPTSVCNVIRMIL